MMMVAEIYMQVLHKHGVGADFHQIWENFECHFKVMMRMMVMSLCGESVIIVIMIRTPVASLQTS